jgi:hypothetical protein
MRTDRGPGSAHQFLPVNLSEKYLDRIKATRFLRAPVAAFGPRNIYGGWVSMRVLLIVSALLIVAGGVSIVAAVMGNPIRIGRTRFPGPESSIERAVIGVIGAVCLAAIVPAFIIGAARDGNAVATLPLASDATSAPEVVVTSTDPPSPTATPEPPAGPSTAPPVPGKPTVTSIVVSGGLASGCSRPFSGIVHVSNGPVTVRYRIFVDGVLAGAASRTKTVTGTGATSLDTIAVAAAHSGAIKVRYDILGPNPTLLTGSITWTAPAQCQPSGPPGPPAPTNPVSTTPPVDPTTPPPVVQPTLAVSISGSHTYNGPCDAAPSFTISGSVAIGAGTGVSVPVGWNFTVDAGVANSGTVTAFLGQSTDLPSQTVTLTDTSPGDHTIQVGFSATSPDTVPGSDQQPLTISVTCTSP